MSSDVWKCPKCTAQHDKCGKGDCMGGVGRKCGGLVCECECSTDDEHGLTHDDPCPYASCYHCGWGGTIPSPMFNPAKLKGWAKKAYDSGWKPPAGWTP